MRGHVVVTGGAGFIGSEIVARLVAAGREVVVVDDYSGDSSTSVDLLAAMRVCILRVQDTNTLTEVVRGADVIVHLASSVLIRGGEHHPERDVREAYLGTQSALEAGRRAGVPRFCFASTASVYGCQGGRLLDEDAPLRPVSLYAAAKAGAEALVNAYAQLYGVSTTIFRFGNVQGPGLRRGVIADFVAALAKDPTNLRVLGDGQQRKSYIALRDCVEGVVRLGVERPADGCQIYNLSADGTVSVLRITELAARALGARPTLTFAGGAAGWPGDVPQLHLNAARAKAAGWLPQFSAEEAVRASVLSAVNSL